MDTKEKRKHQVKEDTKPVQPDAVKEDKENNEDKEKVAIKKWVKIITIVGFALAIILMLAVAWPVIKLCFSSEEEFLSKIENLGMMAYVALFIIQVLQVVIAIIPGGVVQFAAGFMSEWTWVGILVCIAGVYVGQVIIFKLVRRFGRSLVEAVADNETIKKWDFIHNQKKLELITFILYVIPGLPKDVLCYLFPLTPIKEERFMVISTLGRIPAIASSVYAAEYLRKGDYITAAIIWTVILVVSVVATYITSKILSRNKDKNENTATD